MEIQAKIKFINNKDKEIEYNLSKKYILSLEPDNFIENKTKYMQAQNYIHSFIFDNYSEIRIKSNNFSTFVCTIDDLLMNSSMLESIFIKL